MARLAPATARSQKANATHPARSAESVALPIASSADEAPRGESETKPEPIGRFLSARQFWDLMERWRVPDAAALELLDYPGKIGASGKRPRFRFSPGQKRITSYLPEVDSAMTASGKDIGWLHKKNRVRPFEGRTPIAFMVETGVEGMGEVLRTLTEAALRRSLRE